VANRRNMKRRILPDEFRAEVCSPPLPNRAMHFISAQIVRFVDSHQPGWVECEFVDADGRRHTLTNKVPVFTAERINADSNYPRPGAVPCVVLERFKDERGRELTRVSTEKPCDIKSAEGLAEFTVLAPSVTGERDLTC
jgi:hypothetical protein